MNFFSVDMRKVISIAIVVLMPLIYFNQVNKSGETPWYAIPFAVTGGALQHGYGWIDSSVRHTLQLYFNLVNINIKNRELLQQNRELLVQLAQVAELRQENERLNKILEFKARSQMDMIAARVIGDDLLTERLTITINKGDVHGVRKGQAVISTAGVVGYILRADPWTSHVLLMTDRYAVIDALVQRTRARGIVEGTGPGKASLRYLERIDDVQEGDTIITNGLDNIFPKGFPIAKVVSVRKANYGISVEVDLKPIVSHSSIEELFVIKDAKSREFSAEVL